MSTDERAHDVRFIYGGCHLAPFSVLKSEIRENRKSDNIKIKDAKFSICVMPINIDTTYTWKGVIIDVCVG